MNMFYYYEQHLPKYKVFKEEQEEILSQEKKDQLSYFNQRWSVFKFKSLSKNCFQDYLIQKSYHILIYKLL